MTALDGRTMKRKSIRIGPEPEEGATDTRPHIEIPVMTEGPFVSTNGQIFNYRFINNSENESRQVTTHTVKAAIFDSENEEIHYGGPEIDVERMQVGRIIGTNGQIFKHRLWNNDPAPKTPEAAAGIQQDDIGHYKVHYVRYYANNNDSTGTWIDVEYVDQLKVVGTNGQIYNFRFRCPDVEYFQQFGETPNTEKTYGDPIEDDSDPYAQNPDKPLILGYCDPALELLEREEGSSIDPPWRLDPLTNIVNLNSVIASFYFPFSVGLISTTGFGGAYHWYRPGSIPPSSAGIGEAAYLELLRTAPQYPSTFTGTTNDDQEYVFTGSPTMPDTGAFIAFLGDFGDYPFLISGGYFLGQPLNMSSLPNPPYGQQWFTSEGPDASISSQTLPMWGIYNFGLAGLGSNPFSSIDWRPAGQSIIASWATPTYTVDGVPWRVKNMTFSIYANLPYVQQDGFNVINQSVQTPSLAFIVDFEP